MGEGFEGGMETSMDSVPASEISAEPMETPFAESFNMPEDTGEFEGMDDGESDIINQIGENDFENRNANYLEMNDAIYGDMSLEEQFDVSEDGDAGIGDIEGEIDDASFSGEDEYPSFEDQLSDDWSDADLYEGIDDTGIDNRGCAETGGDVEIGLDDTEFNNTMSVIENRDVEGFENNGNILDLDSLGTDMGIQEEFQAEDDLVREDISEDFENKLVDEILSKDPEVVDIPEVSVEGSEIEAENLAEVVDDVDMPGALEEVVETGDEISPEEVIEDVKVPEIPEEVVETGDGISSKEVIEDVGVPEIPEEVVETGDEISPKEVIEDVEVPEVSEDVIETGDDIRQENMEDIETTYENTKEFGNTNEESEKNKEAVDEIEETDKSEEDEEATDEAIEEAGKQEESEEESDDTDEDDERLKKDDIVEGNDGGKNLNVTEENKEVSEEDDEKKSFLKDESYDAILIEALNENNSGTTTLENLNNTVFNLDGAIESNDLKIQKLQDKISETDDPEERVSLENQLLSAQEYKSMLEETRETAYQRRMEALDLSKNKLSEMKENLECIRKHADANLNEIREGSLTDENYENMSLDTTAALETAKTEQSLINQACENKYQEIYDYITANNMDRYDCQYNPEYRRMVGQYREMLDVKDYINETVSSLESTNEMIRIESDGRVQPTSFEIKSPVVNLEITAGGKDVESAVKQANDFQRSIDNGEIVSEEKANTVISDLTNADIQISQQIEAKREQLSALNITKEEARDDIRFQKINNEVEALKKQKDSIKETAKSLEKTGLLDSIMSMEDRIKEAYSNRYYNPFDGRHIMGGTPPELVGLSKNQINAEYEKALAESPKGYDFITNDGEKITFKEGICRITSKAVEYMNEMKILKEKQKDVIAEMEEAIKKQHYCAIQRSLGDHGVKHIYGNYERSDSFLQGMDPETKLATLIAEVHHDEGYTDSSIHCPGNFKAGTHGMLSAAYFNLHHRSVYEGVFTNQSKLNSVVKAMATHNDSYDSKSGIVNGASLSRADMERNLNVANDVIVSAVHLADKLALSEREKMPLIMDDPKMKQIMQAALLSYELVKESDLTGEELIEHKAHVDAELREGIEQYLVQKDMPEMYKLNFIKAIEDINTESGKFNIPMNMIGMSSTALKMEVLEGQLTASMHIDILDEISAKTIIGDGYDRQIRKLFEDLHIPENKAKQIAGDVLVAKEKDVTVNIGNGNRVILHKKEIVPEDIYESREQYETTGKDIEKSNLSLYSKYCNEIKEALDKDDLESWTKVIHESFSAVRLLRETRNVEQARELLDVLRKSRQEVWDFRNRIAAVSMKHVIERQEKRTMETIAGYYREYYKKNVEVYKKYHHDILQRLFNKQEGERN